MLRKTMIAAAMLLPTFAAYAENGYSEAAQRLFNMVGDCPAGGDINLDDEAVMEQHTQLKENNGTSESGEESVFDLKRVTRNRCE